MLIVIDFRGSQRTASAPLAALSSLGDLAKATAGRTAICSSRRQSKEEAISSSHHRSVKIATKPVRSVKPTSN